MLFMGCGIFRIPFFRHPFGDEDNIYHLRYYRKKSPKPAEGDGCATETGVPSGNNSERMEHRLLD
ncbi:hypothetical protein BEI60_28625 [Eisenbergiella tayi]|nr:hypothetical protein BEI60_28625 [Eisenbergiella tayi]